jgi:protein arginine kinase activator
MKCDCCEREATVHEVSIQHGKRSERHLCEQCAQAKGVLQIGPMPGLVPGPVPGPMPGLVPGQAKSVEHPAGPQVARGGEAPQSSVCPACGMTFAGFRQAERLGCAACYVALEGHLLPLIQRVQEGACQHVGKVPKRALGESAGLGQEGGPVVEAGVGVGTGAAEIVARVRGLREELERALSDEQYERAASLRDEIARLVRRVGGGPAL